MPVKINYKELLEDTIGRYKNDPLSFEKRKDKIEYRVENGAIYLRIGDVVQKSMEKKELEDEDFQRFYNRLIEILFDKL